VFRCLLRLPDGEPLDPAMLVKRHSNWSVGDVMLVTAASSSRCRDRRLPPAGASRKYAIFTVEPV
jgi:hypothetical protein